MGSLNRLWETGFEVLGGFSLAPDLEDLETGLVYPVVHGAGFVAEGIPAPVERLEMPLLRGKRLALCLIGEKYKAPPSG